MRWHHQNAPEHEGFIVGLVVEPPCIGAAPRPQELQYPEDEWRGRIPIKLFQAGCSCGWRSPHFRAPPQAYWLPFAAELGDQELEDFAGILWMEHWHLPDPLAERAVARVPRAAPLRPPAAPIQDATGGGQLDLADDAGGPRHFLQGRALDAGDAIELLTAEGRWIFGHYDNQRFGDYLDPIFHFDLACAGAAPDWAAPRGLAVSLAFTRVSLPPDATLRWPPR